MAKVTEHTNPNGFFVTDIPESEPYRPWRSITRVWNVKEGVAVEQYGGAITVKSSRDEDTPDEHASRAKTAHNETPMMGPDEARELAAVLLEAARLGDIDLQEGQRAADAAARALGYI